METYPIKDNITICFVTATSFPQGIEAAHQKLHSIIPFTEKRRYFGISRPEQGTIIYKAAAEILPNETITDFKLEQGIIARGNYICLDLKDYPQHMEEIGTTFARLTSQPGIDPQGYCVEWYTNQQDMRCMIRLADQEV
ncbi:MAG: transcriptional regulator [Bacteroidetes bacterium]|nr:transcriptional regulator [Bacteroidota bacterium]